MKTRRQFSKTLLAGGAAMMVPNKIWSSNGLSLLEGQSVPNAQPPKDLDLVIKGGTVIDPGQNIHSLLDVAVRQGKIAEVSRDIAASRARMVISAKDRIVTPGFIDVHAHCYDGVVRFINAEHYCLARGVTTVVDAGSSSYQTITNFRKYVIDTSPCRIFALINIDGSAFMGGRKDPAEVIAGMDPQLAAQAVVQNRPTTVGIKVLLGKTFEGDKDVDALTRAIQAGEASATPVMAHTDNTSSPLPELLRLFRKGDVYTHCYNGHQHNILDANGKVLPEAKEARQRGVLFDPALGVSHFSFDVAKKCLAQDFLPDTISTDLDSVVIYDLVYDLPTTVSKFLALGMDLDKAIERVTSKPASVFDYNLKIGTLKPGYEADISIFEMRNENFEFFDSDRQMLMGHQRLINKMVVCKGDVFQNQV